MRILITGATGFIGRHLLERLAPEHELIALVRRIPPRSRADVTYIVHDLCQALPRRELPDSLDVIIHQAALIDAENALHDADPFLVNVVGTWRLLEYAAAVDVQHFIHASTGGIYGCSDQVLRETDPPNPMDLYSLTKAQAELAVQAARGPFRKIVLRYFFPYGLGTPNPIPGYVSKALSGEPIQILESGKPIFNPIHISDAVEATVRSLSLETDAVLNIAGAQTTSFAEIAEIAASTVGRSPQFQRIPDADAIPYYRANLVARIEEMVASLKLTPQVSLHEGIGELARQAATSA